jgi:multiple sugar transport system permease protein
MTASLRHSVTLEEHRRRRRRRAIQCQVTRTLFLRIPLLLYGVFVLGPIYWVVRTSFMANADAIRLPLRYLPLPFTAKAYVLALSELDLVRVFTNSLLVAGGTCILGLFLVLLTAYSMSRFTFWGKTAIMLLLAATQMVPGIMVMIPYYIVFGKLGLIDTLWSLIIAEAIGVIPFSTLMLKQFFDQVSSEIDDAAQIDGCTRVGALFRVIMPLIVPGIVAITIFNFLQSWNSLMMPVILLNDPAKMTLPARLMLLRDQYTFGWALHAAGGVVNLVPAIILFALIQRHLISGLTAGAVKG